MKYLIERKNIRGEWDLHFQQWIECSSGSVAARHCQVLNDDKWRYFYTDEKVWDISQKLASAKACADIKDIVSKDVVDDFAELINLKFTSGNDIPVDSIRLSREEAKAFMNWCCKDE